MSDGVRRDVIVVAGTNGAGKSTVINELLRDRGVEVLNPDQVAKVEIDQGVPVADANSRAWHATVDKLQEIRDAGGTFAFETTLGGRTITALISEIVERGGTVRLYYIGLESADLHVQRVAERVQRGGHAIREDQIRFRYTSSLQNLVRMIRMVHSVRLYENTHSPRLVARVQEGGLIEVADEPPGWVRAVLAGGFGTGA